MEGLQSAPSEDQSTSQALSGRLPILFGDRIFKSYQSILLTFIAISAASYSYLVGTALVGVGSTRLGILGYFIGMALGTSFVMLAGGGLSFRFGVDTVDAGKAALGMRGSFVLLLSVLGCTLGWAFVLLSMTVRASVRLAYGTAPVRAPGYEVIVVASALLLLVVIWWALRRGAGSMERVSNYCAAAQLLIAFTLLGLICYKFGWARAWYSDAPTLKTYTTDRMTQLTYAVEFGMCNALGMLPYMGGLSRLIGKSKHLIGPTVVGYVLLGAGFISAIGALATATTGEADPAVWIPKVAGSTTGSILLAIMLIANLGALVAQVYLASIAVQQIQFFARLPWRIIVALVLTPGVVIAFRTQWVIDHVMNWLAYNGVVFVGLSSVLFVDFFILRRERIAPAQLFAAHPRQLYWFWGGVNWIAAASVCGSMVLYLSLFDPVTLHYSVWFKYTGASLPSIAACSLVYYVAMRIAIRRGDFAGYRPSSVTSNNVEVSL